MIVYQLKCTGVQACFNGKGSMYSKTVYTDREQAEAAMAGFRDKCVRSEGSSHLFDLEDTPRTVVEIIELLLAPCAVSTASGLLHVPPQDEQPRWVAREDYDAVSALTAPRLTLADIIADPPEGWVTLSAGKAYPDHEPPKLWEFQHESGAIVEFGWDLNHRKWLAASLTGNEYETPAQLIASNLAINDLLLRLAEVPDV